MELDSNEYVIHGVAEGTFPPPGRSGGFWNYRCKDSSGKVILEIKNIRTPGNILNFYIGTQSTNWNLVDPKGKVVGAMHWVEEKTFGQVFEFYDESKNLIGRAKETQNEIYEFSRKADFVLEDGKGNTMALVSGVKGIHYDIKGPNGLDQIAKISPPEFKPSGKSVMSYITVAAANYKANVAHVYKLEIFRPDISKLLLIEFTAAVENSEKDVV